ncbi:MAG: cytochrome c biogenesis protein ResB [Chloroflexi bacterium]|nr:cytochrome c biogenesis protein ResB [Chloroflexota bacterium]
MPPAAAPTKARRSAGVNARVERWLRTLGDPRLGLALLLAAGAANAIAAAVPETRAWLDSLPYLLLVGAIALTGVAGVAVRLPAVWREWRRPGALGPHPSDWSAELPSAPSADVRRKLMTELRGAGFRVQEETSRRRWSVHGVKRGWARLAGLTSHLALVVMVVGAALGTAFAEETVFGLFPGEQSLLGQPRPGLTASVRFDAFDAAFGADGRPTRLDTSVTFVRDGRAIRAQVLRVNEPGAFDGYLVHGWTYGPAAQVRVTDLAGRPLADTPVALGGSADSRRAPFVELPTLGLTLGLELVDAAANEVRIIAAGNSGVVDNAVLRPGEEVRLGSAVVRLTGLTAYVTFVSRSDPGILTLFAGAGLLTASLMVGLWLPRRRLSVTLDGQRLRFGFRGERIDQPTAELERIRNLVARMFAVEGGAAPTDQRRAERR